MIGKKVKRWYWGLLEGIHGRQRSGSPIYRQTKDMLYIVPDPLNLLVPVWHERWATRSSVMWKYSREGGKPGSRQDIRLSPKNRFLWNTKRQPLQGLPSQHMWWKLTIILKCYKRWIMSCCFILDVMCCIIFYILKSNKSQPKLPSSWQWFTVRRTQWFHTGNRR